MFPDIRLLFLPCPRHAWYTFSNRNLKKKKKKNQPIIYLLPIKLPPSVNWKVLANQNSCEENLYCQRKTIRPLWPKQGNVPAIEIPRWSKAWWVQTCPQQQDKGFGQAVWFSQAGYFSLSAHLSLCTHTGVKITFKCLGSNFEFLQSTVLPTCSRRKMYMKKSKPSAP